MYTPTSLSLVSHTPHLPFSTVVQDGIISHLCVFLLDILALSFTDIPVHRILPRLPVTLHSIPEATPQFSHHPQPPLLFRRSHAEK